MRWNDQIRRRLKLRDLDTLLAVAHWGSMAKAAAHLSVSQPAVSKAIADMEHTLGVRLLDRTAQGVEPTAYGRALLKGGVVVFNDLRQAVKDIEFLADPTGGEVRVGCPSVIAAGLLSAVLDRFSLQNPRTLVSVTETRAGGIFRELRGRNVDVSLSPMASPIVEGDLNAEVLFEDQVVIVAGKQSPWAHRRQIELAE